MRKGFVTFTGSQGKELPAVCWLPDSAPAAVLQITHGITEHLGRYESLAQFLCPLGIAVQFRLLNHYRHVVLGEKRTGAATIARNLIAEFLGRGAVL